MLCALRFVEKLVEEDEGDGQGGDPTHEEQIETEEGNTQRAVVRDLGMNQTAVEFPPDEETDEDAAQGQDNLGRDKVEEVEEAEATNPETVPHAHGQRTSNA